MEPFLRAIDNCATEPVLKLAGNKLLISSEKFKVNIPIAEENYPASKPDQNPSDCGNFISPLRLLYNFIGTDAQRSWACGIYLNSGFAYATNNVVLSSVPCDFKGQINLPTITIDELLRLSVPPSKLAMGYNTATFYWEDGTWMKSSLLSTEWPDISQLLQFEDPPKVPIGLQNDVARVSLFTDKKKPTIMFKEDGIEAIGDGTPAEVLGYNFQKVAYFRSEHIIEVLKIATNIDLSLYPKPCPFIGNGVRGVVIGSIP